jgi:hypothetical protein
LPQERDDLTSTGGKTSRTPAQSLSKSAGKDIHTISHAKMFRSPFPVPAQYACGVAIIDQNDGIMPLSEFRDAIQPGEIAIHGEDPISRD